MSAPYVLRSVCTESRYPSVVEDIRARSVCAVDSVYEIWPEYTTRSRCETPLLA